MHRKRGWRLNVVPRAQNRCKRSTEPLLGAPLCGAAAEQISACTDMGKLLGAGDRLTVQIVLKWVYGYPIAAF
jgi:hypothetical protein